MGVIETNPRLPHLGSSDYDKQLNARLYELLRQMAIQVNAVTSGNLPVVTTTEKGNLNVKEGTMVFDTTLNKACIYTGAGWETITSV
jgi:hypothetical protein